MKGVNRKYIYHPRKRFIALPLWRFSKLRSLRSQNDNVRKRLFETVLTNGYLGLIPIC